MQSKKNIIFTTLLCAQVSYTIVGNPAEAIAQAMKESATIQAEALKDACEAAPKVGLESAEILASAFLEASPKAGSEAAQILSSAFNANSNEAASESPDTFIDSVQTTVTVIKGLIAIGCISTCLYIALPKISRYFSSK